MNSLDHKLAKIFKATLKKPKDSLKVENTSGEFRKILSQVVNTDLHETLKEVFSQVSRPTEQPADLEIKEALRLLRVLLDQGFKETPAVLFLAWLDALKNLSLEQILPIAPTAICLGKWIKTAKASSQEIERQLLDQPDQAYASVGADWLLEHAKPQVSLLVVAKLLTRQPRPEYLLPWNEALAAAIKKDTRGELLAAILKQPSPSQEQILTLSEVVRSSQILFKAIGDLLPTILARKDSTTAVVRFVHCLFDDVIRAEGSDREFATALLARVGTGILLADRRTSNSDEVLALIRRVSRQLRNLTKGEAAQTKTWVFENVRVEDKLSDGKLFVNLQGARYVALAFEKVDQGFPAKEILSVTARYLGLSPIGKNGETVCYEPLQHEDVDGGLLPGEFVVVLESGWSFNEEAVMRANVRKRKDESHV